MHVSACAAGVPISCTQDTSDVGWSVLCGGVVVSLHVGRGWSRRLSTAYIHHTTRRACRQRAFDVEWGALCVCVAPPPPTRTTSSTTQNRSTLNMSHKTACMQTTSHCDNGIQFMQLSLIWLGYGPPSTSDGVQDDSVPFTISLQVALHLCSKLLKMEMGSSLR